MNPLEESNLLEGALNRWWVERRSLRGIEARSFSNCTLSWTECPVRTQF